MHAALIQARGQFEQFTLPSRTSVPNPVMRNQYGSMRNEDIISLVTFVSRASCHVSRSVAVFQNILPHTATL